MRRTAKIDQSEGSLSIGGLDSVLYLGSVRPDAIAESCLAALYDHHQCTDDFKEGDEIEVDGVGIFRAVSFHIVPDNEEMMQKGRKPYNLRYEGVDGSTNHGFDTVEEAKTYIKARWQGIDYCSSDTNFHTDHAQYYLSGFKLSDVGEFTGSGSDRDFTFKS